MVRVNIDSHIGDRGVESIVFYGEARDKHFNGFLDIVFMNRKIITPILSHFLREFLYTYSSGWEPVVFISEEGDKEVK